MSGLDAKEATRVALVLLRAVAPTLQPCNAAVLRDAIDAAQRATGVRLQDV